MSRTARRRTLVGAVVLVAAACTSGSNLGATNPTLTGDGTSLPVTSTTATDLARSSTTAAGVSSTAPTPSTSTTPEEIPEFQRALLEDGVTFDEYESAVLAAVACLEANGIEVYGPYRNDQLPRGRKIYAPGYDPSLTYSFGWTLPDTASSDLQDAADAVYDDCVAEYLDHVEAAWSDVTAPTEEELDRAYEDLVACLRDQGFEIDDPWTRQQIDDLFGLPGFDACY